MVPELENTVSTREEWRALVLCGDAGLTRKNPFDLVEYVQPKREFEAAPGEPEPPGSETEDTKDSSLLSEIYDKRQDKKLSKYLKTLKAAKFAAFEQAAQNPLTRLMTFLCEAPLVTKGINEAVEDPEFEEYYIESIKKAELREKIRSGETVKIALPSEVLCLARRSAECEPYDIKTSWTPHDDLYYSRFVDRNMYFDKMRFFVFDILPKNHRNYSYDYIRYLFVMLLMASNDLPAGIVKAGRVYSLGCEDDEQAFRHLFGVYDAKLNATVENIELQIKEIKSRQQERLSDQEAESIFCSSITIPVQPDQSVNEGALYADAKAYGLSEDCAKDEYGVWSEQLKGSEKTLKLLLKQPRRALKKATSDIHRLNEGDCDKALVLNEFQVEDIEEHIANEELLMVGTHTVSVFDTESFDRKMKACDAEINKKIDTRMTKEKTLAVGAVVLLLYLAGFLPLLFGNMAKKNSIVASLLIILCAVFLLAAVLFVCLFFLRGALKKLIRKFNAVMQSINAEISDAMTQFSVYLSHACNIMRGYSVLKYRDRNELPDTIAVRILKKHIADIRTRQSQAHDMLGKFSVQPDTADAASQACYEYDFTRATEYPYPLPYKKEDARRIEFLQRGNFIIVPFNLVRRITMKREEIYDE